MTKLQYPLCGPQVCLQRAACGPQAACLTCLSYMVLNGMIIVNGEAGKICKPAVMVSSNVTSQTLFWVTAKALLKLPSFVLRT